MSMKSDGVAKEVIGGAKQAIGKITGDKKLEVKGAVEKAAGTVQKTAGKIQEKLKDATKK